MQFPSSSEILSAMSATFMSDGNANFITNMNREISYNVEVNTGGSVLEYKKTNNNTGDEVGDCHGRAQVEMGNPPNTGGNDPRIGCDYYVADFHAHPQYMCRGFDDSRIVGPSVDKDVPLATRKNIPSFVYDYVGNGGYISGVNAATSLRKIYSYGSDRKSPYPSY